MQPYTNIFKRKVHTNKHFCVTFLNNLKNVIHITSIWFKD